MVRVLLIGGFGLIGTVARYLAQGAAQRLSGGTFPYGTLAVNVLGLAAACAGCAPALKL